ncbi:hypothetical protein KCM76_02795 [Zooshikella marina]|uniref:hypothetical protein n=1 Tax=Zooshikella ganghwensis TaxID=202772 RepID=UPI001BAEE22B|nr:hypothetical protein [Zooshikella ganghwensis]MBU2704889.1 hypothetical protein [Zooshikella ganghwensis]
MNLKQLSIVSFCCLSLLGCSQQEDSNKQTHQQVKAETHSESTVQPEQPEQAEQAEQAGHTIEETSKISIVGNWAYSKEDCQTVKTDPATYHFPLEVTSEKISGYEWSCNIQNTDKYEDGYWHIQSQCSGEGESYEEQFYLKPKDANTLLWNIKDKNRIETLVRCSS